MSIQQLQQYISAVSEQLEQVTSSLISIEDLKDVQKGDDIFAALTNGIFVKATVDETTPLLVNVGAGVIVEKTHEEVKEMLKVQKQELEGYYEYLIGEFHEAYEQYVRG